MREHLLSIARFVLNNTTVLIEKVVYAKRAFRGRH